MRSLSGLLIATVLTFAILVAAPFDRAIAQTGPALASAPLPAPAGSQAAANARKALELQAIEKLNAWTVGLAGGQLEGAPIRFATEIARVVDDGDNLHVLPIVTRGPVENVEALLYLKGVDAAIISSDALAQFKSIVPDVQQRIVYILNLFPSEVHVFVRPEIQTLADLNGKKVNFNTPGTSAAFSGPLIFDQLKLNVEKTFIPHQVALEQMRAGQDGMEAVVFVTTKPVDAFVHSKWDPGFKFLPVSLDDFSLYLPSTLTSSDYPQLIAPGTQVRTIAVPTILAAFNWPKNSDRFKRVARLTDYLFDRLDKLREPGFHPAWKDVNIGANVPGLERFSAAQDWIDLQRTSQMSATTQGAGLASTPDQQRLLREFLEWRRQNGK